MEKVSNKYADVPVRVRSWLVIILIVAVSLSHVILTYIAVCLLAFKACAEYMSLQNKKGRSLHLLVGLVIAAMLGHLALIVNLDVPSTTGVRLVLLLIITAECNDIFQYLTGKMFGKRKIAPKISPNKTVEGFLGGLILTPVLTNLLGWFLLPERSILFYTLLGLGIAFFGFCGDLFISRIKRRAGVKDTGRLIPGHGGLLDRVDSLIFSAPLFYWLMRLMYS